MVKPQDISQQISNLIDLIHSKKIILTKVQEKMLKAAQFYPDEKFIPELNSILERMNKPNTDTKICYPGGLSFEEFDKTGCLKKVNNVVGQYDLYFYFDINFITNFQKLSPIDQEKFQTLSQAENIKLAAASNDQGIKNLTNDNALPKCHLSCPAQDITTHFSHELKINESAHRIGIITLKPVIPGPHILLATHVIKDGFHSNKHIGKNFFAKTLFPKKNIQDAKLLNKAGFFATKLNDSSKATKPEFNGNEMPRTFLPT